MLHRPRYLWAGYELRSPVVARQIEWAAHHRDLIQDAYNNFRSRNPYSIAEDHRVSEGTRYRVLTAHPEPAPDELGLMLADYLHALRAALDYLVGAMRPNGPSRASAFPIFLNRPPGKRGRFRNRACESLRGIPDDAVKLIHWMQPYHLPEAPARHPFKALAAIDTLWNISKHRTLLLVTAATEPDWVGREGTGEGTPDIGFRFPSPDYPSSEIWLPMTEPPEAFDPHFTVKVSLKQPPGFATDWPGWVEGWEFDSLVDYLFRVVRWEVVPIFNQFIVALPPDGGR